MDINLLRKDKESCYGCRACEHVCPAHCISMLPDEEGFLYPVIDEQECNQCLLCLDVCPNKNKPDGKKQISEVYCVWARDDHTRSLSSSGGLVTLLSEYIIKQNGVVFGVAYDGHFHAHHIQVESYAQIEAIKGSKYVQSDTEYTFLQAETELAKGRKVLYIGTPCQIAGLKNYLGRSWDNLFLVDLVCHGVPSPKLFSDYISALSKRYNGKITEFSFRDKDGQNGPVATRFTVEKNNIKRIYRASYHTTEFFYAFEKGLICRPSCYQCPYAEPSRQGDITAGDYWGADRHFEGVTIEKGVSLVLLETEKGKMLFNDIKDKLEIKESNIRDASNNNWNLLHPTIKPPLRDIIYKQLYIGDLNYNLKKYLRPKKYWLYRIWELMPLELKKKIRKLKIRK